MNILLLIQSFFSLKYSKSPLRIEIVEGFDSDAKREAVNRAIHDKFEDGVVEIGASCNNYTIM